MQVSMDPGAAGDFILLGGFMGIRPIAFGIPPEASEGEIEFVRWKA